jgi:magnesium chelatase subunit D
MTAEATAWDDAALAACLFAVDPTGTGGACIKALPGPVRERWLALLRDLLPAEDPIRRIPLNVPDERLLGGLDLTATLRAGRTVGHRGLLADSHGGVVVLAMAERLTAGTSARLSAVLDAGEVVAERDGLAQRHPARLGVVALDEAMSPDERVPAGLADRLAFHLDLGNVHVRDDAPPPHDAAAIAAARAHLADVRADDEVLDALCATALVLGIDSLRAPLLALRVAHAAAALAGRTEVATEDAALAGRLVFSARATRLPAPPEAEAPPPDASDEQAEEAPPAPEQNATPDEDAQDERPIDGPLEDIILAAAAAAMPDDLLSQLKVEAGAPSRQTSAGRVGRLQKAKQRGRPIGTRRGAPEGGARLHVIETLKAAAPWQRVRRAENPNAATRIAVRRDDFRTIVFKQRSGTTTIFVVDASGSAALQRLAETKGAVELLLADAYVRRDKVALIAFRGQAAELLLPPTNALARARRSLAGLPGGGGTPLASGIDAALALAETITRAGQTPIITLLTDGRANIARDGAPGRPQAEADALTSAARVRAAGLTALLIDTSPRPHPMAQRIAEAMHARYFPLPQADAAKLSRIVRANPARAA